MDAFKLNAKDDRIIAQLLDTKASLRTFTCRNLIAVVVDPGLVPAGTNRHEECFTVGGFVLKQLLQEGGVFDVRKVLLSQLLALPVEFIREPLEEKHSEDVFFVL
jgi:hypothetical protein